LRKNRLLPENILSGKVRDEYIKAKGEIVKNKYDYIINGFEVIDELSDCRVLMEQIQKNIETSWEQPDYFWERGYKHLKE